MPPCKGKPEAEMTPEEREEARRARSLAQKAGMSRASLGGFGGKTAGFRQAKGAGHLGRGRQARAMGIDRRNLACK